jgi:GNAT superfamily N-acetyltransferase
VTVRLLELDSISEADWEQVIAGEPEPFGGVGEQLHWRGKSRNVGLHDSAGRLVGLAGVVLAEVRVGGTPLQVAGIGGVIVTRAERGRGLARALIERVLEIAPELGAELAMLFCLPANVDLYARFGFRLIEAPVWVRQPGGMIEMPMETMWRPLTSAASWPSGPVELLDQPF